MSPPERDADHERHTHFAERRSLTCTQGHVLNEFVRDVAIKYVDDDDPEIREASALTCCQLYVRDPIVNQTSQHALQVVADVIDKLIEIGISDREPKIRQTVLAALDERFDMHLAKTENIKKLFFALQDEQFNVREVAISIIGRLATYNSAYITPQLRKIIIQLLTELEYTDVARSKEESAKLLSLLTQNAQDLVQHYVDPIAAVLLPKARDPTPTVAATILQAIGALCTVGGDKMLAYKDQLMPIIIDALNDLSSPAKREAALRTLGELASHAGYVIKPYIEYPQLMEILQQVIRTESHVPSLRRETMKVLGIVGALDPYKYQVQDLHPPSSPTVQDKSHREAPGGSQQEKTRAGIRILSNPAGRDLQDRLNAKIRKQQIEERLPESQRRPEAAQLTDVSLMMTGITPSQEEYYPTVVINALLHILQDSSLVQWHGSVVDAIMQIFTTMGLKCVQFLDRIVPAFLAVVRGSAQSRLEFYFNHLGRLVGIVRQHIRVFLKDIIMVLEEYWDSSPSLQWTILSLIESIARSLEGEFKVYLASLLPLMLSALERDTSTKRQTSERILHAFLVFGSSGEEYMHLIIPVVVRLIDNQAQPTFMRKSAIDTIAKLSSMVNLNDHASKIIHPLTRVISGGEPSVRQAALDCLCALMQQLGQDYLHFERTVNRSLQNTTVSSVKYEQAVAKLKKGEVLPQDLSARFVDDQKDLPVTEIASSKKQDLNPMHLKQAWDTKGKSTKDDWHEWFRKFSTTLLSESPNLALRACAVLANSYQPLARELFNSAFVSCWGELYEQFQVSENRLPTDNF